MQVFITQGVNQVEGRKFFQTQIVNGQPMPQSGKWILVVNELANETVVGYVGEVEVLQLTQTLLGELCLECRVWYSGETVIGRPEDIRI